MVHSSKTPPAVIHLTHQKAGSQWIYQVLDEGRNPITEAKISSRQTVILDLSVCGGRPDSDWQLTLLAHGVGKAVEGDPRTLCYRVFQLGWAPTPMRTVPTWEDLEYQA